MEDLNQQLQQILSDPQSMQQIQGLLASLGKGGSSPAPGPAPAAGPDLSALAGMLGALGGAASPPAQNAPDHSPGAAETLGMVTKLAPLLSQASREDDATRLLRALRPLLGEARQKKVDEALRILQMMRLLPLLKESGVFSGLLSGLL